MKPLNKAKVRLLIKKVITIVLPVFSSLFIVGTTAIIIALINGYSLDINKRVVIKTGVLNVETYPIDAEITVSGEYYGKSNRAIPNLKVGNYSVTLSKEGFFPYTKKVEIHHGLASPVIVPMLRTNGQKEITKLKDTISQDYNSTGYYVLSATPLIATETNMTTETSTTPTPTPTKAKNKIEPNTTYTLTRVYITKPLFDDPHPVLDEKMSITTFTSTPITSISVSPTGKLLLVTLTDKSGTKSISLIPFKRNTTVNANLTDSKSLTSYQQMKNTRLIWSKNGDYIIVETPEQIISFNVKAGTRVILAEKAEILSQNESLIWNTTEAGIVLIKKSAGTKTNTYEISDISYNGNPLSTQLPALSFEGKPSKIWSFSTTDTPRFVIATTMGTYLLGKLYDAKTSDYEISMLSEKVGTTTVDHFGNDYSRIKISEEEVLQNPMIFVEKHLLSFTEKKGTSLTLFIYNKRSADKMTSLGRTQLFEGKNTLTELTSLASSTYIAALYDNSLFVTDTTGENTLTLQKEISTFTFGQNETALLFTNKENTLFFRILR